ncbi:MAG TPA: DUF1579 family protein [Deinococcales bacterium]|nr:DUF1579 family protein [Deinococcales bacterium]
MEALLGLEGDWRGNNRLYYPHDEPAKETESTARVTPVLGGRFLRVDYTWSYQGQPQEGSMLVGHDPKSGKAAIHWIDTWHVGRTVQVSEGTFSDGTVDALAHYPAPEGPPWGWRTELKPLGADRFAFRMWNIPPGMEEVIAVEAEFSRA